ncbi:DUF1573 domain-containing protein [Flavihumibacter petaseus]|uniref:DUF1573 domain-containing protein n=1 Tax=Flavihumibacter petaseus NBRC 106054 TaxID=1220578 RepID=A0A0E9MZW6_9BACT|nr:DUF1573 domain-containing protein [Flavihumibacter petaseus]GAO42916.1 hypothetical protein FPE01S_02_00210 [Flavihumibacter petaseus NBRC 106054]
MKRIALTLCAVIISAAIFAQTKTNGANAANADQGIKADQVIRFAEMKYNFGKIKQGVPVTHVFEFTNISAQPLVIESARASCGCTTPTWPQQPTAKGKGNKITAGFNASAVGPFEKTIFVTVTGIALPVELKISGEVLTAEQYAKFEAEKGSKKDGK